MKIVFALTGNNVAQRIINEERPPNVLCSQLWIRSLEKLTYAPDYVLLDSGAFSAWSCGEVVKLEDYCAIARRIQSRFPNAWCVNLDVIPGEAGRTAKQAEIEQGMAQSLANADSLRRAGLRVSEVFHQNEPFAFLDQLLERRNSQTDVVGLSPRNDLSVPKRVEWLRSVLGYLVRKHGVKNLPRFHGLAATGKAMLEVFPFYSADSSSWVNGYRYGGMVKEDGTSGNIVKSGMLPSSRCKAGADLMTRQSIRNLVRLETTITRLWETRGVVWNER